MGKMKGNCTSKLLQWYQENKRDLPWRNTRDPYRIWISEIMLQQTRVDSVIGYYNRFLEAFPDIRTLAAADLEEVLALWKGLGYYSRAKNLHKAANWVMHHHSGNFPTEYEGVRSLPGVGDYTAGAIVSIAYNCGYPAVDGNVLRFIARLEGLEEDITLAGTKKRITEIVQKFIPEGNAGDFTQSLMELGALVCTPGTPNCSGCPVMGFCKAYSEGLQGVLPIRKKKEKPSPEISYWVGVLQRPGEILMEYRQHETLLGQMWGLPMVQKKAASAPERLFQQKYGEAFFAGESLGVVTHVFTHRVWKMDVIRLESDEEQKTPSGLQWISAEQVGKMAVPTAFQKVLALLPD